MLRRFENFKINQYLFGKPLSHDWVARGVFPIHSASLQSQFRLPAAGWGNELALLPEKSG